jgi:ABC-2 type transport system permease protein
VPTFLVPIAFAVTVPAQALTGRPSGTGALLSVGVAALVLVGSRCFRLLALRRYTGASA